MSVRAVEFLLYFSVLWLLIVAFYVGISRGWDNSYVLFADVIFCGVAGYLFRKLESRVFSIIITILAGLSYYLALEIPVEELQKSADYVSWDITLNQWFNLILFVATISGTIAIFKKKKEIKDLC